MAIAGDMVWLTSTGIYSQEHASDLIGLNRATGEQRHRSSFDDNMYGWADVAFGAGKVVFAQGGSFGGTTPRTLRVYGLGGPRPTIADKVLPLGRVGVAFSHQLTGGAAPGPLTWTVTAGALPSGLTLSSTGLISGTPTAGQTTRATIQVKSSNGRTLRRALTLTTVAPSTPAWVGTGRNATRNAVETGNGTLDLENATTFGYRWKTSAPGPDASGGDVSTLHVGNRIYSLPWDGVVKAWDSTGSAADRAPLWSTPASSGIFRGDLSLAGDRLITFDNSGRLTAISTSTGATVWQTPDTVSGSYFGSLVIGTSVFIRDGNANVRAYSTVDGSPLWGGTATDVGSFHTELSSDGTRLYGVADCELYAINAATGATVWNHRISLDESNGCVSALYPPDAPIVLDGEVYAAEPAGKMVVNAVSGEPRLRFPTASYYGGAHIVVGGAWIFINDERLVAVDTQTGELLWKSADAMTSQSLSATGDLILTSSKFYSSPLLGISRITGEVVWNGGDVNSVGGTPVIGTNRIFLASREGVRAFGPL